MAADANVNCVGFHEIKGDNVQIADDIATWNPVANGAFAFSQQPLIAGVPVEVEITGSGRIGLGIISTDPKKLKDKPLCRREDIPQYFQINEVRVHKRECCIATTLMPSENKVLTNYDGKEYTHTIKPGMNVWLALHIIFGDITLKLCSCKASSNYCPIFSEVKGTNLQIVDGMNEVRTLSPYPAAMCFIKNSLKVNQRMSLACEPLTNGRSQRDTPRRFHLTLCITDTDPRQLYRQHKHMFTVTAAQTSEQSWVCSVTMEKDDCNGKITIERATDSIIFTDASNKGIKKQIHIGQTTISWVALELYRVSVRQVEIATLPLIEDLGAAPGCILHVNQPQQRPHIERLDSRSYVDVTGNADTPDIEPNPSSQLRTSTPRDDKIKFRSSYNGNFATLVSDLSPICLCDELLSLEVITGQQYEEITSKDTVCNQNRKLLLLLCKKPVSKLQFISSLQKSGNGHLVQKFFPN